MGPQNAAKKDGLCWGILRTWWCPLWGTALSPTSDQEVLESELPCDTVHCYVSKDVDLGFETLGLSLNNPIRLWTIGMRFLSTSVIVKLPTIWKLPGVVVIFLLLTMVTSIIMRCGRCVCLFLETLQVDLWITFILLDDSYS